MFPQRNETEAIEGTKVFSQKRLLLLHIKWLPRNKIKISVASVDIHLQIKLFAIFLLSDTWS